MSGSGRNWQVGIGPLLGKVERIESGGRGEPWTAMDQLTAAAALVERLEAIADGLENLVLAVRDNTEAARNKTRIL